MRSQVVLRPVVDDDAPALVALWDGALRRGDGEQQLVDVRRVVARVATSSEERLIVAELDGRVVGAVHLEATTISPINLEPVLRITSPHVLPECRRHGIGRTLIEAATAYAEERSIGQVATAVLAGARDSHRFMARLGLGRAAVFRIAPTALVKCRLGAHRAVPPRRSRQLTKVIAARRSMRRSVG